MNSAVALKKPVFLLTVRVLSGPHAKETFSVEKQVFTIGRGADNDIILQNDPRLSRTHIRLTYKEDGRLKIESLNSRNPILYKEDYENLVELKSKDKIQIGDTELELEWEGEANDRTQVVGAETLAEMHEDSTESEQVEIPEEARFQAPVMPNLPINPPSNSPVLNPNKPMGALSRPPSEPQNLNFKLASLPPSTAKTVDPFLSNRKPALPGSPSLPSSTSSVPRPTPQRSSSPSPKGGGPSPAIFIVILVFVVGALFLGGEDKKNRKPARLKDLDQIGQQLNQSATEVTAHIEEKHLLEDGRMDRQYESAQSFYIKGFRDYRQGQFGRAITSFQAALSFDPGHTLAKRYLSQSIKKEAEILQFNLDQARRYREKNNFRLCISFAQQVLRTRAERPGDQQYKDAKRLNEECDTLSKGRF